MGDRCGPCFDRGDDAPTPLAAGWPLERTFAYAVLGPDGRALGLIGARGKDGSPAALLDTATGRTLAVFTVEAERGFSLTIGPGGARSALFRSRARGPVVDLLDAAGRPVARLPRTVFGLAFAPSGEGLVSWGNDGLAWRDGPLGRPASFGPASRGQGSACFSADGARLATRGADYRSVVVWDVATRRETARFRPNDLVSPPCITPGGAVLCVCSGGVRDAVTGGLLRAAAWPGHIRPDLACDPDGSALLGRGPAFRVLSLRGGADFEGGDRLAACDFLPDGRLLTLSRVDGRARLWPAEVFRGEGG
jgi:hypothetical protein